MKAGRHLTFSQHHVLLRAFKIIRPLSILLIGVLLTASSRNNDPTRIIRKDLKRHYDQHHVQGSFVLYNEQQQQFTVYNKRGTKQEFSPASTFKICNALIGLETGVIEDKDFVLAWDSVIRQVPNWNKDQDLKTAFQNSTVWYFQELARRVGAERMAHWIERANYGNASISGGIDQFWLSGGLRISPEQQIDFLRRLKNDELPFSPKTMACVKEIMRVQESPEFVLRAKTGWGDHKGNDLGWYVGYVEAKNNVYYFANCITSDDRDNPDFAKARVEITRAILREMEIIP